MPPVKRFVAYAWCPTCRSVVGRIDEEQFAEGHYRYATTPSPLPTYCSICEGVIERKLGGLDGG